MRAEGYEKRRQPLGGWEIEIETYQVADTFYCTINNVDPGARFARAEGTTREEAEARALEKAEKYIKQTRRFSTQ
ncbi:MAG TPA: hypothetical protein VFP91_22065 [Vicinamibacterales bacterium]|nr:hypothetical protein [Vicinamibacterales bacterium]